MAGGQSPTWYVEADSGMWFLPVEESGITATVEAPGSREGTLGRSQSAAYGARVYRPPHLRPRARRRETGHCMPRDRCRSPHRPRSATRTSAAACTPTARRGWQMQRAGESVARPGPPAGARPAPCSVPTEMKLERRYPSPQSPRLCGRGNTPQTSAGFIISELVTRLGSTPRSSRQRASSRPASPRNLSAARIYARESRECAQSWPPLSQPLRRETCPSARWRAA